MRSFVLAMLAVAVLFPATAGAAAPVVTTGGVADVQQTTATLKGTVDANGNLTSVFFEFGPSTAYGAQTTEVSAGSGTSPKALTGPVVGLTPFTKIHYRLVAHYGGKTVRGKDRVFRTKRQPLGLSLVPSPSSLRVGGTSTLNGNLAGTGNAGRQVVLQANPAPYAGFVTQGNPQVVGATGDFSFPVLDVRVSTQYRVVIPDKPEVVSPIAFVGVRQAVATKVRKLRRHHFRFFGALTPGTAATVTVQRHARGGAWKNVDTDVAVVRGAKARYSIRVKVRRRGTYRVLAADLTGFYVPNVGRSLRVRPNRG